MFVRRFARKMKIQNFLFEEKIGFVKERVFVPICPGQVMDEGNCKRIS